MTLEFAEKLLANLQFCLIHECKDLLTEFKSLRLLSCIAQMAHLSVDRGFNLLGDAKVVAKLWAPTTPAPKELDAMFSLQVLRVSGAHNLGAKKRVEYLKALKVFGINEKNCVAGWGLSLDKVYDTVIIGLRDLNQLIRTASGLD
jgi:hypothetical protein